MTDAPSHSRKRFFLDQESPRAPPSKRTCLEPAPTGQPPPVSPRDFQSKVEEFSSRFLLERPLMQVLDYMCSPRRFNITDILEYNIAASAIKVDGGSQFPTRSPLSPFNVLRGRIKMDKQRGRRYETISAMKRRLNLPDNLSAKLKMSKQESDLLRSPTRWIIVLGLYQKYIRARANPRHEKPLEKISGSEERMSTERDDDGRASSIDNALFSGDEDQDDEDLPAENFDDPNDVFHSILSDLLEKRPGRVRDLQMARRESIAEWMERLDVPSHMRQVEYIEERQVEGLRSEDGCEQILEWHERVSADVERRKVASARVLEQRRHSEGNKRTKEIHPTVSAPAQKRSRKSLMEIPPASTSRSDTAKIRRQASETSISDQESSGAMLRLAQLPLTPKSIENQGVPQREHVIPSSSLSRLAESAHNAIRTPASVMKTSRSDTIQQRSTAKHPLSGGINTSVTLPFTRRGVLNAGSPPQKEAEWHLQRVIADVKEEVQGEFQSRIQELETQVQEYRSRCERREAKLQVSRMRNEKLESRLKELEQEKEKKEEKEEEVKGLKAQLDEVRSEYNVLYRSGQAFAQVLANRVKTEEPQ